MWNLVWILVIFIIVDYIGKCLQKIAEALRNITIKIDVKNKNDETRI